MADYLVESSFRIDDKASRPLGSIISSLEKMQTTLNNVNNLFGTMTTRIENLRNVAGASATLFTDLNAQLTGTGRRLQMLADRGATTTTAIEGVNRAGLQTTFVMADMATEAERVATTMATAAAATTAAGRAAATAGAQMRRFGGPAGGGGGGGHGGAGGMSFGGGLAAGAAGALGFGRGAGHFAMHAANAAMLGMIGLDIAKEGLQPGLDYAFAQSRFATVGVNRQDQMRAKQEAERIATDVKVASPSQVLEDIYHMFGVSKSMPLAIMQAERMAKGEAVISSLGHKFPNLKSNERQLSSTILRAAEQTGNVAFSPDDQAGVGKFNNFLDNAVKMLAAEGGNVTPEQFKQTLVTMRTARTGISPESLFADAAFFMSEMGGKGGRTGSVGSMFQQLGKHFRLGGLNQTEASRLMDLGLMGGTAQENAKLQNELSKSQFGSVLKTIKSDPRKFIKHFDQLEENPFNWILETWLPAVLQKESGRLGGGTSAQLKQKFEQLNDTKKLELLTPHVLGMGGNLQDLFTQVPLREHGIMANRRRFASMPGSDQLFSQAMQSLPLTLNKVNEEFKTTAELLGDRFQKPLKSLLDLMDHILTPFNKLVATFDQQFPHLTMLFGVLGTALDKLVGFVVDTLGFLGIGTASMANDLIGTLTGKGPTPLASPVDPTQALTKRWGPNRFVLPPGVTSAQTGSLAPPPPPLMGGGLMGARPAGMSDSQVVMQPDGTPVIVARRAPSAPASHAAPTIIINAPLNVHGDVGELDGLKKFAAENRRRIHEDTAKALAQHAMMHAATTTQAGGHVNTPKLSGTNN